MKPTHASSLRPVPIVAAIFVESVTRLDGASVKPSRVPAESSLFDVLAVLMYLFSIPVDKLDTGRSRMTRLTLILAIAAAALAVAASAGATTLDLVAYSTPKPVMAKIISGW